MTDTDRRNRRPMAVRICAWLIGAAIAVPGLFLLFADIPDDSPLVALFGGWGWAFAVTKFAALILLAVFKILYDEWNREE
ncbi:MAG: hypothetical protein LUD50_03200 [Clostridia bacterium]|nr:hypothetical protein [Clostridia bacterium]